MVEVRARGKSDNIERVISVMEIFRNMYPEMPAQMVTTFLIVATSPDGVRMSVLAERLDIASSSVSRNVGALGRYGMGSRQGLELVEAYENPDNRKEKIVKLTTKGERVINNIVQLLS